jgi:N utilization substance protein B
MKNARRRAREWAVQGLYEWLVSGNGVAAIERRAAESKDFEEVDKELFTILLRGAIARVEELEGHLAPLLTRPLKEVSPVEHAVLLMAGFELLDRIETPYRVVINEAVEVTKAYGGTDGHKFVNGVLDRLAPILRGAEVQPRNLGAPAAG